jgi:hypothetical protein
VPVKLEVKKLFQNRFAFDRTNFVKNARFLNQLSGKSDFDHRTLFQVILKHEAHPGKSQDH